MAETGERTFTERRCGGWLGLYDDHDGLRFAVTGSSKEHAAMLLEHSLERWTVILAGARPPYTEGEEE